MPDIKVTVTYICECKTVIGSYDVYKPADLAPAYTLPDEAITAAIRGAERVERKLQRHQQRHGCYRYTTEAGTRSPHADQHVIVERRA